MTISEIYKKYKIPINLQEHMLRSAAVGKIICENLESIEIEKDLVVKTLLLHDMGNIIKFDFKDEKMLDKKDRKRVNELKNIQKQFIEKYGNKVDKATLQIIKEIATDKRVVELCENSHWEKASEIIKNDYWDRKVVCYADMRIGPFGIIKLDDRFSDLIKRRPRKRKALRWLYKKGVELETQIQSNLKFNLNDFKDVWIKKDIIELKNTLIP